MSAINRRKEEIRSLKRSLGGDASRTARSAAAGRQSQPLPRSSEPLPAAGRTAKRPNESSASQEVAEAAVSPPKRGPVSRTSSKEEASQPIATTAVADPLLQLAGGLAGGGGSTAATQPETASALAGRVSGMERLEIQRGLVADFHLLSFQPRRRKATAVHVQPVDDLDDL